MEAMPPFNPPKAILDASKRHPVFFTDRLVKSPIGVLAGGWVTPVAKGYVFDNRAKRGVEGTSRL